MDEVRDLVTRNGTSRVVWYDTIHVVPVTWDFDVSDSVNLSCVLDVTEDEVGAGLNPDAIYVGTWCDFRIGGGWSAELRSSANEKGYLKT